MATKTQARTPRRRSPADRRQMVLRLRELLIHAARALAEELEPGWASVAVVTVELRDGEGSTAIRFPSRRE